MMIHQLFIASALFLTAGCTTLTTSSTNDCLPIREVEPIIYTLEVKSSGAHVIPTEKILTQNSDSRSGLTELTGNVETSGGTFKYRIVPYEVCADGLRIRYENFSKQSVVLVPWDRISVIDGTRNGDYFVEMSVIKGK